MIMKSRRERKMQEKNNKETNERNEKADINKGGRNPKQSGRDVLNGVVKF